MPQINVHTPFTLTLDDQTQIPFRVGVHDVSPSIAEHWYTLAHATVVETAAPQAAPVPAEVIPLAPLTAEPTDNTPRKTTSAAKKKPDTP